MEKHNNELENLYARALKAGVLENSENTIKQKLSMCLITHGVTIARELVDSLEKNANENKINNLTGDFITALNQLWGVSPEKPTPPSPKKPLKKEKFFFSEETNEGLESYKQRMLEYVEFYEANTENPNLNIRTYLGLPKREDK